MAHQVLIVVDLRRLVVGGDNARLANKDRALYTPVSECLFLDKRNGRYYQKNKMLHV
jgi:hypothetical protein